jgi:hypothetical protein
MQPNFKRTFFKNNDSLPDTLQGARSLDFKGYKAYLTPKRRRHFCAVYL